jgi:hypothetical protein
MASTLTINTGAIQSREQPAKAATSGAGTTQTVTPATAEVGLQISDIFGLLEILNSKQATVEKGQPNGYASLGGDGKVPLSQLPSGIGGGANAGSRLFLFQNFR